jgi:hypothetical protein
MCQLWAWQWVPIDDECKTIASRGGHCQNLLLLLLKNHHQRSVGPRLDVVSELEFLSYGIPWYIVYILGFYSNKRCKYCVKQCDRPVKVRSAHARSTDDHISHYSAIHRHFKQQQKIINRTTLSIYTQTTNNNQQPTPPLTTATDPTNRQIHVHPQGKRKTT